jgi:GNAT superfamily N-acetyltransferase
MTSGAVAAGPVRFVVLTTFPGRELVAELSAALAGTGRSYQILDQAEPELLDLLSDGLDVPDGLDIPAGVDVMLCWPRFEELWREEPSPLVDPIERYLDATLEVAEAAVQASRLAGAPLVFVLPATPRGRPLGVGDDALFTGVAATAAEVRRAVRRRLAGQRDVYLLDAEEDLAEVGRRHGYGVELYRAVSGRIARLLRLLADEPVRALVVSADRTLWTDSLGADGAVGVDVAAGQAVQRAVADLSRAGVLVAVCADAPADELDRVLARSRCLLRRSDVAAVRPDAVTPRVLSELAAQLGVPEARLAVLVATGDAAVPGFRTIHVRAGDDVRTLLDLLPPDADDLRRLDELRLSTVTGHWGGGGRPGGEPVTGPPIDAAVRVRIAAARPDQLAGAGAALLSDRGFTLAPDGPGPAELAVLAGDPGHVVRLVAMSDADGDHGLVGLYALRMTGGAAQLRTFRLAPAAAGRGVAPAMVADLVETARAAGAAEVSATVRAGDRNGAAVEFFAGLGCQPDLAATLPYVAWPAGVEREPADA